MGKDQVLVVGAGIGVGFLIAPKVMELFKVQDGSGFSADMFKLAVALACGFIAYKLAR